MSTFVFANNAGSTLAGAISTTATTINLASGTGTLFPALTSGQQFTLTLISATVSTQMEIVYVTAISGDALTVVRGREGTAGQAFNAGDFAKHMMTAAALNGFAALGPYSATDTGTANAIAISVSAVSALAAGQIYIVKKSSSANTGAATINVNGIGATSVVWPDGTALNAGEWSGAVTGIVEYDGTQFNLLSVMGPSVFLRKAAAPPIAVSYITSTQTVTIPVGATRARSRGWGGGGGGGGTYNANSGGGCGGGGGYFDDLVTGLVAGNTITCTIGAGGAGGASSSTPTAGGTGGATSFGSYASANGGTGGGAGNGALATTGGSGGTASITTGTGVALTGGTGGTPYLGSSSVIGGSGGPSPFGGAGIDPANNNAGHSGNFPGGGAGGGALGGNGGVGASGLIIVEFYP